MTLHFNSHPHEEDDPTFSSLSSVSSFQLTSSRRGWPKRMYMYSCASIFQLTSSRRGWLRFDAGNHGAQHFNSHPHEEDDDQGICKKTDCITFQLTSSRRGWHIVYDLKTLIKEFQLTSSRRGWLQMIGYDKDQKHFNSHPHEEDDMAFSRLFLTSFSFQLTSSRRGWQKSCSSFHVSQYFNSHPHEEDDVSPSQSRYILEYISTHILTKRMTLPHSLPLPVRRTFQLTSSRRGWLSSCSSICAM